MHRKSSVVLTFDKVQRTGYSVLRTPFPITAELQVEHREFPGPIGGTNPPLTSLQPEDPERGAPTRLLGKRASRGTRRKIAFDIHRDKSISAIPLHINLYVPEYPLDLRKQSL